MKRIIGSHYDIVNHIRHKERNDSDERGRVRDETILSPLSSFVKSSIERNQREWKTQKLFIKKMCSRVLIVLLAVRWNKFIKNDSIKINTEKKKDCKKG